MTPQVIIVALFTLVGFLGILMLYFYLQSERYKNKWQEAEDQTLQLADKDEYFEKKYKLMRDDERQLFNNLNSNFGNDYFVFPQVHLSDLISVKDNIRDHDNLFRMLGNRSVDFAFFRKDDISPVLVIELNGASHFAATRQNRDQTVRSVIEKAGIKFLTIDKQEYDESRINEEVKKLLSSEQV